MTSSRPIYERIFGVWETTNPVEANEAIRNHGDILLAVGVDPYGAMHYSLGRHEQQVTPTEFDVLEVKLRASDESLAEMSLHAIVYLRRRIKDLEEEAGVLAQSAMEANDRAVRAAGVNL